MTMALYKSAAYLTQTNDNSFDIEHRPADTTPYSAIYRCMGCGLEIVSEEHKPLPPQNHHQHAPGSGSIRWRMIVYADHKPK
jgi:hypothetical protein